MLTRRRLLMDEVFARDKEKKTYKKSVFNLQPYPDLHIIDNIDVQLLKRLALSRAPPHVSD
jgi:hypothetical protein